MTPRRTSIHAMQPMLAALLALLLLLTQQMGMTHALSHWVDGGPRNVAAAQGASGPGLQKPSAKQLLPEQVCAECLVFAQTGAALDGAPSRLPPATPSAWHSLGGSHQVLDATPCCGFLSRAPPASV